MKKVFNVTGACNPKKHYMVDISERLAKIKTLIEAGSYFTINRARQYGKTTTLTALQQYLGDEYAVIYMDFQFISAASFKNEESFVRAFAREFVLSGNRVIKENVKTELDDIAKNKACECDLGEFFIILSNLCAESTKPIVLIVDEVDSASNNQVFLDFLSQLRGYYIHRENRPGFQSVILAGVQDIRNVKQKIRPDDDSKTNSPWNIAAEFDVSMSFSKEDILGMLDDYEKDHCTGMNKDEIAELIYEYTAGYPFLVSLICKVMDEKICDSLPWDKSGFLEAVKRILAEKNALFESLVNKLTDYPETRQIVYEILFSGKDIAYNALSKPIAVAEMFGFIRNENNKVVISNRIFETVLYNYFLSEEIVGSKIYEVALQDKNQFVENGRLNMKLVLEKFVESFDYLYGDKNEKFLEDSGRRYFMLFLKPIVNGVGNCYVEARTRNMKRTDIIVDYRGEQYVIELKIWAGAKYNSDGEKQVVEYLDYYGLKTGYMLTFNLNKKKEVRVTEVVYGDRVLIEAFV
jgi:hypothetical protein